MMKIDVATGQLSCKFRVYGVERLHETCRFTRDTPRIYSRNSHSPGSLAGPSSPPLPSPPRVITGGTSVRRIRVKTLTSRLSSARSKAHNSFSPRPVSEQKACNARKMLAPDSKLFRSSVITSLGLPPPTFTSCPQPLSSIHRAFSTSGGGGEERRGTWVEQSEVSREHR